MAGVPEVREAELLIDARCVSKDFDTASGSFRALDAVSLRVHGGELVAVVGRSGSGKSTLANIITGIDRSSSGEVFVAGTAIHTLSESRLAAWRGRAIGVVFQFYQLLPTLTIAENVMLPMDFCRTFPARERRARALDLLERVEVADQADKLPSTLSGGQQQRAAIARALANDPPILVADEPTGNLDSRTANAVLELLAELAAEGKAVVVVTHERDIERFTHRVVTLVDGAVVSEPSGDESARPSPEAVRG